MLFAYFCFVVAYEVLEACLEVFSSLQRNNEFTVYNLTNLHSLQSKNVLGTHGAEQIFEKS